MGILMMTLDRFFMENNKCALAFSGGVDSAYLLYAAKKNGCNIQAYYVKSPFQPEFELADAKRLACEIGTGMKILYADTLLSEEISANPEDRCYHCKKVIFGLIIETAKRDGYTLLLDGTNASDDADDRPGMRATAELSVRSPLRECGLTKAEIRNLSKTAGLFTWDKPSYSCLATRIPSGTKITVDRLQQVEESEQRLFSLGFSDFRIRYQGDTARIQITEDQMAKVIEQRILIREKLAPFYQHVVLDLQGREKA